MGQFIDGIIDELLARLSDLENRAAQDLKPLREAAAAAHEATNSATAEIRALQALQEAQRGTADIADLRDLQNRLGAQMNELWDQHDQFEDIQEQIQESTQELENKRSQIYAEIREKARARSSSGEQGLTRRLQERRRDGITILGGDRFDEILRGMEDPSQFRKSARTLSRVTRPSKKAFKSVKKYVKKAMGPLIVLTMAADIASAQSAYSGRRFSGNWLSLLAYAISRDTLAEVNVDLYKVIRYFSNEMTKNIPNQELADGFAYFQNALFVELMFRALSRMSTQNRKLLGKHLRELLNAPQTVSDPPRATTRGVPRIVQTPPKPRPAMFPDMTKTDLMDEIYMNRLRKAYWLRQLKRAEAALRTATFADTYVGGTSSRERKERAEAVAKIRDRIREHNDRIKAYDQALKEPFRDKGPGRTYEPMTPLADLPTVEKAIERALREKLGHVP
jgi:hypothetical protein